MVGNCDGLKLLATGVIGAALVIDDIHMGTEANKIRTFGIQPDKVLCSATQEVGDCSGLIHIGTFSIKPSTVLCASDPDVGDCPSLMIASKIKGTIGIGGIRLGNVLNHARTSGILPNITAVIEAVYNDALHDTDHPIGLNHMLGDRLIERLMATAMTYFGDDDAEWVMRGFYANY